MELERGGVLAGGRLVGRAGERVGAGGLGTADASWGILGAWRWGGLEGAGWQRGSACRRMWGLAGGAWSSRGDRGGAYMGAHTPAGSGGVRM